MMKAKEDMSERLTLSLYPYVNQDQIETRDWNLIREIYSLPKLTFFKI